MNILKWFISQVGQSLHEYNEEKKRLQYLKARKKIRSGAFVEKVMILLKLETVASI